MVEVAKEKSLLHDTKFTKELLNLARSKLAGLRDIRQDFEEYTTHAKLAIIDVRLQLDYDPTREAAMNTVISLVASHMRTALSVPQHRNYLRSCHPSEPWLAEAAAHEMNYLHGCKSSFIFDTLNEVLGSGIIDIGERGEVVARLIIMRAYDRAVQSTNSKDGNPIFFSRGCLLTEFINCLFSPKEASNVLNSVSDVARKGEEEEEEEEEAQDRLTLGEEFKKARIRSTHFERVHSSSVMSDMGCIAGIMRCAAYIAKCGQEQVDMLIPIILDAERTGSGLLRRDNMTAILIQVKNRIKWGGLEEYSINADGLHVFSGGSQPYITLVMELGVLPPHLVEQEGYMKQGNVPSPQKGLKATSPRKGPKATSSKGPEVPPPGKRPERFPEVKIVEPGIRSSQKFVQHPRYRIYVYGCSSRVYGISSDEEKHYHSLLRKNLLFTEHPRQNQDSIDALYRFIPCQNILQKVVDQGR